MTPSPRIDAASASARKETMFVCLLRMRAPFLAAIAVLVAGPVSAQDSTARDPCAGVTTVDMRDCAAQELREADSLMAVALDAARKRAAAPQLVDSAQAAWLLYRRAHCAAVASEYEGGSLQPVLLTSCFRDTTRERVRALDAMFRQP